MLASAATPAIRRTATTLNHRHQPVPPFSTTRRFLNASSSTNPELPKFNLKAITSNPRTRRYLILTLAGLVGIETYFWYKMGTRMWGSRKAGEGEGSSTSKTS